MTDLDIDIIFPNLQEGQILSGENQPESIVQKLNDMFPNTVIALKLDSKGALILADNKISPVYPNAETIIDATGRRFFCRCVFSALLYKKESY